MSLYTGRYTLEDASAAPEICHEWHLPHGLMPDPAAKASVTAQAALLQPWVWGEVEDRDTPDSFISTRLDSKYETFRGMVLLAPLALPKSSCQRSQKHGQCQEGAVASPSPD